MISYVWMESWDRRESQADHPKIVVGGGTAGLAVASRLSQHLSKASVLVIEAGPDGRDVPGIYITGLKGSTLGSAYDWNFTTTPQPGANGRVLPQNRGRVLGGSSALNLLSYDRGVKADFDAWEDLGNEGWNWNTMHSAMEEAETFQRTSTKGEAGLAEAGGIGFNGPIHFLMNRFSPPQQELVFPTMQNLGLNKTSEFLNGDLIGYMRHTSNILNANYTRNYATSYLLEAGDNLHLMLNTTVSKVNLDRKHHATGVTLTDGTIIAAKNEVILSAGSIQTPQLLELSGIGSRRVLAAAGVATKIELCGVGENLQDHIRITISYQLRDNYTSPDILRINGTFAQEQRDLWARNISGWYDETSSAYGYMQWDTAGYDQETFERLAEESADLDNVVDQLKLRHLKDTSLRVPQLEVLFNDGYIGNKGYPGQGSELYGKYFASFIASINHAYARGSTHINSSDVLDHPLLNPRYLSKPYDVHAVAMGAKYLRQIATTAPMSDAFVSEYEPGLHVSTVDEWEDYGRANFATIWHPLGTCAMLPKAAGGVVDSTLIVYGTSNLRVVDASIMPILVSGHIQTAVYGIAERAATMIAQKWT